MPSENEMLTYTTILRKLNYSNRAGFKAPHKAIYLISVMDMIADGAITQNRFMVNDALIQCFEQNWKKYVGETPHFICNIWNPVNYMEQDVIKRVFTKGCEDVKPACIERAREVFQYLEIPKELWELLQDENCRYLFRCILNDTYIINNRTKNHQGMLLWLPWIVNMINPLYLLAM